MPGLDLSGYETTPAIVSTTGPGMTIDREAMMIEWTDRNIANATFEGTARELLRLQLPSPIHPLGDLTFNPVARPGDPEWRVMYVGVGDSGAGEQKDIRQFNPQRLDTLGGKILRIIPDLREHTDHEHGQRERAVSNPERQSVRIRRRCAQGDLGAWPAQSSSADLGHRSRAARRAAAHRVHYRADLVGVGRHHQEGRELRLLAA